MCVCIVCICVYVCVDTFKIVFDVLAACMFCVNLG